MFFLNSVFYWCLVPALIVLSVTALVRANDIPWKRKEWYWHLRRLAMVIIGGASAAWLFEPFWPLHNIWVYRGLTLAIAWSFAITWITTPGLPPWWKYITGVAANETEAGSRVVSQPLTMTNPLESPNKPAPEAPQQPDNGAPKS
jgi:hypothetical protein